MKLLFFIGNYMYKKRINGIIWMNYWIEKKNYEWSQLA